MTKTTPESKLNELVTLYLNPEDALTKLLIDRMPYSARDLFAHFIILNFKQKSSKIIFPCNLAFHFDIHVQSFLTHLLDIPLEPRFLFTTCPIHSSYTFSPHFHRHSSNILKYWYITDFFLHVSLSNKVYIREYSNNIWKFKFMPVT